VAPPLPGVPAAGAVVWEPGLASPGAGPERATGLAVPAALPVGVPGVGAARAVSATGAAEVPVPAAPRVGAAAGAGVGTAAGVRVAVLAWGVAGMAVTGELRGVAGASGAVAWGVRAAVPSRPAVASALPGARVPRGARQLLDLIL